MTPMRAAIASTVLAAALGGAVSAFAQPPMPDTLDAQYAALEARSRGDDDGLAASRGPYSERYGPPRPSQVGLAHRVVNAAAAFEGWMRRAAAIGPDFDGAPAVVAALQTSADYHADQFEEGEVAYVAMLALQDARFVDGVRAWTGRLEEPEAMLDRLTADPSLVLAAPGAGASAVAASASLRRSALAVLTAGGRIKQAAYSVQHQPWSRVFAEAPQARLAEIKARSAVVRTPADGDITALLRATAAAPSPELGSGDAAVDPDTPPAAVSPIVARGLALAALALNGRAGEEDTPRLAALLFDARSSDCTRMAKLNLYQCIAVAGPEYEHMFCLGQHAMMETAQCVAHAAGQPIAIATTSAAPPEAAADASTSVFVPVAASSARLASR